MYFEPSHLYHIYNQGNNKQKIFFCRANYLYFIGKLRTYVLPHADILAWCLMPNHFHLMVQFNRTLMGRTLNDSIGIMLRSYTRAINIQEKRTGALFREETKAICLTKIDGITPAWFNKMGITRINITLHENQYPNECYNYIILNPIKDGLVRKLEDWEFSSFTDLEKRSIIPLINKVLIYKLGLSLHAYSIFSEKPLPY